MIKLNYTIEKLIEYIPVGTSKRFDCPVCKGQNTFSITNLGTEVKFNCFRASCEHRKSSGGIRVKANLDTLKKRLEAHTEEVREFSVPDHWVKGIASKKCLEWLLKHNCFEAYSKGDVKVAYDPAEDRLVFLIQENNKIVGAVGRSLGFSRSKTKNYANSASVPFTAGKGNRLVIVEDIASACAATISKGTVGMALLGVNLKEEYIPYIVKYDTIIVALDYDARKKGLKIKNSLSYFHKNVRNIVLSKDLKDMSKEEILNCLP